MKRITLEKVLWSMEEMQPRIEIPESIRQRAMAAVERMLEL
jgi:quinolinate synthase